MSEDEAVCIRDAELADLRASVEALRADVEELQKIALYRVVIEGLGLKK